MPLSKAQYAKFANEFIHQWEKKLDTYHSYTLARQVKEWQNVTKLFEKLIDELANKNNITVNQVYKLAEYKRFLEEATKQTNKFARFNANLTTIAQKDFANSALSVSQTLLNMIDVNFSRLPVEAINRAIGITSEGSPLFDIFQRRFQERIDNATQLFIEGISRGSNPNLIARNMRNQLDISVYDSTRITRTESLNIYRDTSYNQYKESGIVDSWLWIAESDACPECLAMEAGNPYPIDLQPESLHPFDRCTVAPNIG